MKQAKILLLLMFISLGAATITSAQNLVLQRYILSTGTIEDEGVTFEVSSDDAEQENDEIDALYDDDLDFGWEGAPEDQNILTTGLRFRDIYIPQGAIIDSAFVVFYSHEAKSADDEARITIYGEAADNAQTFTEDALITARPATSASALWEVAEDWEIWQPYRTPDLKAILQEIVNRNGWEAGNSLALILTGENQGPSDVENARECESYENIADPEDGGDGQNHPERRPQLVVYFSVPSTTIEVAMMVTDTIEDEGVVFEASSDDAEQENDEIDSLFDDDLDAGWEGAPEDQNILTTGIRFRNIQIPKDAVVESAYLVLYSHEGKDADDVARITIYGEATDNAQTFTEDALITDRPATSASLLWEVAEQWEIWEPYQTPDLKAIIQEIVNRDGWQAGNALALILAGENQGPSDVDNAREVESFENIADPEDGGDGQNHPERRPRLVITFSSPNLSSTIFQALPNVKELKVFPNPADDAGVTIRLESDAPAVIHVYNANGQLIGAKESRFSHEVSLKTSGLPAGLYFVKAWQKGEAYLQKLIVK